jgi:hypothetical protein
MAVWLKDHVTAIGCYNLGSSKFFCCDILAQGLIGLIEYSYHQGIPSFLEAQL